MRELQRLADAVAPVVKRHARPEITPEQTGEGSLRVQTQAAVTDEEIRAMRERIHPRRVQTGAYAPPRVQTRTGATSDIEVPPSSPAAAEMIKQEKEVHRPMAPPPPPDAPVASRTRAQTRANAPASPISSRTRSKTTANLTQALAASYDLTNERMSAARLAGRKFPKHFFDVANAVLDADTGQMLNYRRLM